MSGRFVLDASVVLAWLLGEPETFERARPLLDHLKTSKALVPAIWLAEVANALVVKERQKRIDDVLLRKLVKQVQELPVEVDSAGATAVFERALPLARRHQLSVYDAIYLELAVRERVPLGTFDAALTEAAKREGVATFDGG